MNFAASLNVREQVQLVFSENNFVFPEVFDNCTMRVVGYDMVKILNLWLRENGDSMLSKPILTNQGWTARSMVSASDGLRVIETYTFL